MTDWQPIETAPEVGPPVLVFVPLPRGRYQIAVAERSGLSGGYWWLTHAGSGAEDADLEGNPTHWQPLPSPPSGT